MGFATALDRVLATLLAEAPPEVTRRFEPWVALVVEVGPTPRQGPLHHDLLWPSSDGVGLNVFDHGSGGVMPVARRWARDVLGARAASELSALEKRTPTQTSWHAGAAHDRARGWRLKLWAHGPCMDDVTSAFGLSGDWTHVGIDLREGGLERARGYRRIDEAQASWEASGSWVGPSASAPGVSHRVVAELGRWPEPGAKRSFDTIFGPEATLDDLFAEQRRVMTLARLPALAPEPLRALEAEVEGTGLRLRPAAHEIDLFPGEPAHAEVLLTLGEA